MTIETERLVLHPLTHHQLEKYIIDDHSLEKELNLQPSEKRLSAVLKTDLAETTLPRVKNHDEQYVYHTLWVLILKAEKKIIGDLCFIGPPDMNGETEIGYGTYEPYRGQGYMTEAVAGLIEWARKQEELKIISATTATDNQASYSILVKNHFEKTAKGEGMFTWKLVL